jgi:hypothetical protein
VGITTGEDGRITQSLADVATRPDDSLYGEEFMSSGEYSMYDIDVELYLTGVTSLLNGSDLSFISIPIIDII